MLWLYQRTMFGKIENPKNEKLLDLNLREFATFAPLIILAVWIGLYPTPFLTRLEPTVKTVIARVNPAYAKALAQAPCAQNPAPVAADSPLSKFATPPCGDGKSGEPVKEAAPAGGDATRPAGAPAEPSPSGGRH
jgi:NADH-quinone oxidoreductase subunit M